MLATGDHSWNSGMFVWQVDHVLEEFSRQMPDLSSRLNKISQAWGTPKQDSVIVQEWSAIKTETVDYGIMEGARNVTVIPAEGLKWSDVGSWDSFYDVLSPDQAGNIVLGGKYVGEETRDSLIFNTQDDRLIVTIGIDNLVVVDTGDVLLVCGKDDAQKV